MQMNQREELEESIRDKWDLECEPLHIIYHNGHLLHNTGKTRKRNITRLL